MQSPTPPPVRLSTMKPVTPIERKGPPVPPPLRNLAKKVEDVVEEIKNPFSWRADRVAEGEGVGDEGLDFEDFKGSVTQDGTEPSVDSPADDTTVDCDKADASPGDVDMDSPSTPRDDGDGDTTLASTPEDGEGTPGKGVEEHEEGEQVEGQAGESPEDERQEPQACQQLCTLVKTHEDRIKDHDTKLSILKDTILAMKTVPEEKLKEIISRIEEISQKVEERKVIEVIELRTPEGEVKRIDGVHRQYPELLRSVSADCPVWLVGSAGSGKSSAAKQVADDLGLDFYCTSVCAQTSQSTFLGYTDAHGNYVRTLFRQAYECGGLFLLDEVDAGNPNVLSVLNAALSVPFYAFPDGVIPRHPDFRIIAAGNTYGLGASREYVGRNPIDGATLDRFGFLPWDVDEDWEYEICTNKKWVTYVQLIRKKANDLGLKMIISPRASFLGAKLLAKGMNVAMVKKMVIYKGLSADQIKKLESPLPEEEKVPARARR